MSNYPIDSPTNIATIDLVKATLADDTRSADFRAAVSYFQKGLEYLKKGDIKAAKICLRALIPLIDQWPSFMLFQEELEKNIEQFKLDSLKFKEIA